MTKANYMALNDLQTLWTNKMKPSIANTYATKSEVPEQIASNAASVQTCMDIIGELV